MNLHFTQFFQKKSKKLTQKNPALRKALSKQFKLFRQNPYHPSLRLHRLQGKRSTQHAIWIKGNLRAVCMIDDQSYVFFDLITHDEY